MRSGPIPILFAVFALSAVSIPGARAQDWSAVPLGTSLDLYAVENTYLPEHCVVGAGGYAARSNADRTQWTVLDTRTTATLYSVAEPTALAIWMGAGQGVVRFRVYSMWFDRDLPVVADFRLFARSTADVVAVGPGGQIFRSISSGPWTPIASGTTVNLNGGDGYATARAWIIGDRGTILRTVDGTTWNPVASGTTADLRGIAELDQVHLYVVGDAGTILKSGDGGQTWSPRPSGTTASLRAVSISKRDSTLLIAAGTGGTVLKSIDRGDTWCRLDAGTTVDLNGAEAVSDSEFLVCGTGGLLLRTTNGGGPCLATGVPGGADRSAALELAGPFPQPCDAAASFRVRCDQGQWFETVVFDVTGRMVLQAAPIRAASPGEQEIALDTRGLAPGVYMVRVESEGRGEARRRFVVTR